MENIWTFLLGFVSVAVLILLFMRVTRTKDIQSRCHCDMQGEEGCCMDNVQNSSKNNLDEEQNL